MRDTTQARRLPGVALLFGFLLCLDATADDAPDVRALMTPEEFKAAGLERLSGEEIEALNRWVLRYTAKEAPELRSLNQVVREEVKKVESEGIHSRIAGEFRGWDGETVFRLENGQVWKQRLLGRWFHRADSPEVEFRKNLLGYWVMEVVGTGRSVGVKRID